MRRGGEAYGSLFRAHLDEQVLSQIRQATNGNYALGGRRFQAQIAKALGRRVERGKTGRPAATASVESTELDFG
jgi:putative transposase